MVRDIVIGNKVLPCNHQRVNGPYDAGRVLRCRQCGTKYVLTIKDAEPGICDMLKTTVHVLAFEEVANKKAIGTVDGSSALEKSSDETKTSETPSTPATKPPVRRKSVGVKPRRRKR